MRKKPKMGRRWLALHGAIGILAGTVMPAELALADWTTYRHDPERSGYTPEAIPEQLSLKWSYGATHSPQPAWPRSSRMTFDRAFQPIIAAGLVCFGSSVDGAIYALDATTGEERWTFYTEAPVRFAPAFWNGRFYVGSDDGRLYCLDAGTGRLIWKFQGAPNGDLVLGNGRMISRWPLRGGVVIKNGIVYFAAGIWPSDGIYLCALEASSGRLTWGNDTEGYRYMGQPHGGADAHSGISPQGYLAATENQLFVPNGRAVPAAFHRADGAFEYFHLQANGHQGGSGMLVADQFFINDGVLYDQETGSADARIEKGATVGLPDGLLIANAKELRRMAWADQERVDRRGKPKMVRAVSEVFSYSLGQMGEVFEAIVAGNAAFLGASGSVHRVDLQTTQEVWSAQVEGKVYGIAAAQERLLVSTDRGALYCFDQSTDPARKIQPLLHPMPYGDNPEAKRAAAEIVNRTGITNGYGLDLGCGDGALAYELARLTQLQIVAVDPDPDRVAAARQKLSAAGLYGSRVTVWQRELNGTGLPAYFANLVISGRSISEGASVVPLDEASQVQRPFGGVMCIGKPGAMTVRVRSALEGAGNWTHQYADPANTLCSSDELVQGPLGMLWFNDVGQRMVQRHGRAPAPLFNNGILYSEGIDSLMAVDAYNGHLLWEYPLPGILEAYDGDHLMGVSGTGSNYCLSDDSVYVRRGGHCLRIDAKTGKLLAQFTTPKTVDGGPAFWGFIASENGLLFGTLANPEHIVTYRYKEGGDMTRQLTESKTFFAMDAKTGKLKWRYDAEHSLRHNAIAIGAGCAVLVDRPLALYDRFRNAPATNDLTGQMVALSTVNGDVIWRNKQDIFGTVTIMSAKHQKILASYQPTRFGLASEIGGRLACYDLSTGERVWERKAKYSSRPLLNDQIIYAEGGAWDLLTGESRPFSFERSYGCGTLASSKKLMVFRSATLGYCDLTAAHGTEEFGGMRPGCWINILPVGGLVLAPDASAGCVCSYPNQAWVALRPDGIRPPKIQPPGAASREPMTVRLEPDRSAGTPIRYTLDGSIPEANSPLYRGPLRLENTTQLRARSFGDNNRASRVVSARFLIHPDILSLQSEDWSVWEAPKASPPSAWTIREGIVTQTANTLLNVGEAMGKAPGAERPGTMFIYQEGFEFGDGQLSFEINSKDDDTVGVAFRLSDSEHYYLWLMDSQRGFRALAVKDGDHFEVLSANQAGYQPGQWHRIQMDLQGAQLTVSVDGQKDIQADDARFQKGSVALYCWGNSGVSFRELKFTKRPRAQP